MKVDEDIFENKEGTKNFPHPQIKQAGQTSELTRDIDEEDKRMREEEDKWKKDEEMKMLVSKLNDLSRPLEVPEYRDAYKVLFYLLVP